MNAQIHLGFKLRDEHYKALTERYCQRSQTMRKTAIAQYSNRAPALSKLVKPGDWSVACAIHGQNLSTDELAGLWRQREAEGTATVHFFVGGADGWPSAESAADLLLGFGQVTMPHALAAVVLTEQVYRVLSVISGHPYHLGH